ncbi:MAG TPA: ABC transporter substrate-binding protein [Azospirillaceae bacterium]|nr:ABC transporter substrate-binding protein [Azospirillaceae bacterium]
MLAGALHAGPVPSARAAEAAGTPSPAAVQEARTPERALRIAVRAMARTADPHVTSTVTSYQLMDHLHAPLVVEDDRLQVRPALAERWEAAGDGAWRFTLRQGVVFQDGSALDAADVAYSFCRVLNVAADPDSMAPAVADLAAVEPVDARTVLLRFHHAVPALPDAATTVPIIAAPPEAEPVFDGKGGCAVDPMPASADFDEGRLSVGAGPYRLLSFGAGGAVMVRNDLYWGPRPPWDRVEFRPMPAQEQMRALLEGSVDLIDAVLPSAADYLRQRGMHVASAPSNTLVYLQFNRAATGPLADERVRRALAGVLDRRLVVERALGGFGTPTESPLLPSTPGVGPVQGLMPMMDVAEARRLLAEAGLPDGFEARLVVPGSLARVAEVVAYAFDRIGVKVSVAASDSATASARIDRGEYDMSIKGWMMSPLDEPRAMRGLVRVRGTAEDGHGDLPELDALLADAARLPASAERRALMRRAEALMAERVAMVPLFFAHGRWGLRPGLVFRPRLDRVVHAWNVFPTPDYVPIDEGMPVPILTRAR